MRSIDLGDHDGGAQQKRNKKGHRIERCPTIAAVEAIQARYGARTTGLHVKGFTTFSASFDEVFKAEGVKIIRTPWRALPESDPRP
jgi:hypothetical protein